MEKVRLDVTKVGRVAGLGNVTQVISSFDNIIDYLKKQDLRLMSADELAWSRMIKSPQHQISQRSSYVQEGIVYVPSSDKKFPPYAILARESPLILLAKEATLAHSKGSELFLDENVDVDMTNMAEDCYWLSPNSLGGEYGVPGDVANYVFTKWLFEKQAKSYAGFLEREGAKEFSIETETKNYVTSQKKPFANQIYIFGLDEDSAVKARGATSDDLAGYNGCFAVSKGAGVKLAMLNDSYTALEIGKELDWEFDSNLESKVISALASLIKR